ncbi:TRAP transporter small permease subunit [Aestuariibacter sp. GS-14]|uniref:TRAP transporter small permease subunit n=1 Tax=Aestuariibacter sp. GS-14 TaxID=2590670 RepID=UPI00112A08F3|nr:TRAP transporter small permease subunit [Aestuariibacter sp. GS-14]TPV56490.1 TRAP transporter small permease subunit [Aestuariibacter sp. GS-14]
MAISSTTLEPVIRAIDTFSRRICVLCSALSLVMVAVMLLIVIFRYGFQLGWIALQESVTYLHAAVFLLALGYTLQCDGHVRVDVFYRRFSERQQARVNFWGTLVLLIPVCCFLLYYSVPYAADSWALLESSKEPGGLPLVFVLKSLIPIGIGILLLQGVSELCRSFIGWRCSREAE